MSEAHDLAVGRVRESADDLANFIRDQVCCPRIHGCELGGAEECPAERVRSALSRIEKLEEALRKIERWHDDFPPTGRKWDDGSPMSYGACFGSNGERDFMREIARQALSQPSSSDGEVPP